MPPLKFDENGLIAAIAQDHLTGEVRMVAWMNQEALARTLETGKATFFSRSRGVLWEKGETSGNQLRVRSLSVDCDADTLLLGVEPTGPSCHTGARNCFIERLDRPDGKESLPMVPFLQQLERVIAKRQSSTSEKSYTKSLLDGGPAKIGRKINEEAGELVQALGEESAERVASETADLLFHVMVGLKQRGVAWRSVIEVLEGRFGTSGHDEKAARRR